MSLSDNNCHFEKSEKIDLSMSEKLKNALNLTPPFMADCEMYFCWI